MWVLKIQSNQRQQIHSHIQSFDLIQAKQKSLLCSKTYSKYEKRMESIAASGSHDFTRCKSINILVINFAADIDCFANS